MRRATVLIVDDEQSVCAFAQHALSAVGYSTSSASSGSEALSLMDAQGPFDLCVIDVMMPEMPGTELAVQLRRSRPTIKILYFTGFSDRLFDEKHRLWEGEAFIEKPCTVEGLREAVSLLLYGHTDGPPRRRLAAG